MEQKLDPSKLTKPGKFNIMSKQVQSNKTWHNRGRFNKMKLHITMAGYKINLAIDMKKANSIT